MLVKKYQPELESYQKYNINVKDKMHLYNSKFQKLSHLQINNNHT